MLPEVTLGEVVIDSFKVQFIGGAPPYLSFNDGMFEV